MNNMNRENIKQNKCSLEGGYFTHYNVKGFTLIELLAVIVILAIIALIATPIILGVINDSKEKAFRLSLKNVEHAYSLYVAKHQEDENFDTSKEINIKDLPLDTKNISGVVFTNEEGKVEFKDVTDGIYTAEGTLDNISISNGDSNALNIKVHVNKTSNDSITVSVETIKGTPVNYSYKILGQDNEEIGDIITTSEPSYTFTGLNSNTSYKIIITATNEEGKTTNPTTITHTTNDSITLDLSNKAEYIKEGTITINYPSIVEGQVNQYKWCTQAEIDSNECDNKLFMKVEENTIELEAQNGTLITRILEKEEIEDSISTNTIAINNIDNVKPTVTTSRKRLVVTIKASDTGSGLHETPYSCNGGTTWQASKVCTFTEEGTYEIKVRDKALNETTKEVVVEITIVEDAPSDTKGLLKVIYYNPVSGKGCEKSESSTYTGLNKGCMKWYAFAETTTTYTVILDHNTSDEVEYNSANKNSKAVEVQEELDYLVSDINWVNTPRLIKATEVKTITGLTRWTTGINDLVFFDNNSTTEPEPWPRETSKYYWLFDYTDGCINDGGCKVQDDTSFGYWTSTAYSGNSSDVWTVDPLGALRKWPANDDKDGVRPVITISKSALQ